MDELLFGSLLWYSGTSGTAEMTQNLLLLLATPAVGCDLCCGNPKQYGGGGIVHKQKNRCGQKHPAGGNAMAPVGADCPTDHQQGGGIDRDKQRVTKTNGDVQ